MDDLVPLPAQPDGVPWPASAWPEAPPPAGAGVEALLDEVMDPAGPLATTYAALVVSGGRLVGERYGGVIEHWDGPDEPVGPDTDLLSWSMAKSVLHLAVGLLVADGVLDLHAPAPVPEWAAPGDQRSAITLQDLLEMRDGLDFTEDYVDAGVSDVIEMLFGAGQGDVAHFAADRPLAAPPGTRFNYSSGTSNIVSGIVARAVGPGERYERFLRERLLDPIGLAKARLTFDAAGTWVASSYLYAPARSFARIGLLVLRDGVWEGRRVLPAGWVDHGRRPRSIDPGGDRYGAHWWVVGDEYGTFWANGYEGQSILVCPALDLVVVRLGKTDRDRYPALADWRTRVVAAFAAAAQGHAVAGG